MMVQYFEVKRGLPPGTLLLFRLGDFFEMFYEDAEAGSRLLGLTLVEGDDLTVKAATTIPAPAARAAGWSFRPLS